MNRIKQLRTERGWTQEELGEKLNVKRAAISKYESGRIPLTDDTIKKLVTIFDKSSDYILGLNDNEKDITIESFKEKNLNSNLCFFTKDDASVDNYFPLKLNFLREKKGISKEYLAGYLAYWTGDNIDADDIEAFEKGYKIPSNYVLKKLSEYFNVPFYTVSNNEPFDIDEQITKLITLLSKKENPMTISNTKLDDEDREYVKLSLEKFLTDAKLYLKHKYTFKKYSTTIDEELENYRKELEAEQKVETSSVSEEQKEKSKKNA